MSSEMQDLDWLAFRYVADELSPDEVERFEQRLAEDQAAREAVEEAVALNESVRLAIADMPATKPPVPSSPKRKRGIAIVGSAACLLLVGGLIWMSRSPTKRIDQQQSAAEKSANRNPEHNAGPNKARETDDLALTWARLRGQQRQNDVNAATDAWSDDSSDPTSEAGVNEETGVPHWLLTAVSTSGGNKENK